MPSSRLTELVTSGKLGRRMGARQDRFQPTDLDAEFLDALDRALRDRIPLAVVLPLAGAAAPLTAGVAALLRALLNRGRYDARIAVCSPHVGDRQLYDQLAIDRHRLADQIPRARITAAGRIDVIAHSPHLLTNDTGGRLYLTAHLERAITLLDTLEAIVIDSAGVTGASLTTVLSRPAPRLPIIYTTSDPTDRHLPPIRDAGGLVWAWDAPTLAKLSGRAAPTSASVEVSSRQTTGAARPVGAALLASPTQLTAAGYSTITIHGPSRAIETTRGGVTLDDALNALWTSLAELSRAHVGRTDRGTITSMQWAWGAYNSFALLPVAAAAYDRINERNPYALSLTGSADLARRYGQNSTGPRREAWATVAAALRSVIAATAPNPRVALLADWVTDLTEHRARGIIGVRNRAAATALRAALRESPRTPLGWDQRVTVAPLASITRTRADQPADEICLAGAVPRYVAGLLAAPPAPALTILTCGPSETRRVARIASAARTAAAYLRAETITVTAGQLSAPLRCRDIDPNPNAVITVVGDDTERDLAPDETWDGSDPWDPFTIDIRDVLATLPDLDDPTSRGTDRTAGDDFVDAIVVYLDETGTGERAVMLCSPNDMIARRQHATVTRVAAKALTPGDTVVLVDRAARRDLREEIAGKLSERIEYATLTMMIDLWHDRAAAAGAATTLTHREILQKMPGTAITHPGTIGSWIRADVDGPLDGADVTRFAHAVDDDVLARYAPQIVAALRTMHSVTRKLGHWLAAKVDGALVSTGDGIVDTELNIHIADLLESVTDHAVVDVDLRPGRVAPASALGIVLPARAGEELLTDRNTTTPT